MVLVDAILRLVDGALRAQNNVVQNRRKSRRLADCLEAILPPLRTIEASESKIPVAHRETLEKLQNVVEDAKVLLEKQCKKSYMSQLVSSSSVKEHFNDITQRLQAHMQALNLSVAALHRVDANTRDAEDAADVQELQEEIRKMIESNQDDLRSQLAELDEGQQGRAREMLSKLTEGHEQLRRDISEDLRKIVLEMSPAQHADSSLPHIDMATDLRSIGRGGDDVLGSGGFGEVKKMLWMAGGAIDVAVKVLHQRRPSPKALKELRKEAEAMHAMRHPNVIQLYGASLTPPHVCLVLEYAPHGSLEDVLEKEGAPSGAAVWRERFSIASDIVKGLIYLHSRKVLHLDIKSGNVMLFDRNSRRGGKLADFGLSFIKNETSAGGTVAIKTSAGTVNWKSPELFRKGGQATRASDIYSCACVMYELASGAIPWDGEGAGDVTGMVSSGDRPDKPEGCIEGFWNLIEHGWAQEPAKRIALVDALDSLETLVKATGGGETDPAPDPPAPPLPPPPLPKPEPDPAPSINSDIDVLRLWREREPALKRKWQSDDPKEWNGVMFSGDRVIELNLGDNQLTSLPAEIGQLTSLRELNLRGNQLTSLPAEIWRLTSLQVLGLARNQLTSLPADIGRLTSLRELFLQHNQLTSVPADIWQLTSLRELWLNSNQLTSVPAAIGELRAAGCKVILDDGMTIEGSEPAPPPKPSINSDIDVLRLWRGRDPVLKRKWQSDNPR